MRSRRDGGVVNCAVRSKGFSTDWRVETFRDRFRHQGIMKTSHRFTLTVLLGLAAVTGWAATPSTSEDKSDARVSVTFSDPENFSDAADGQRGSHLRQEENLAEIEDYIVERASKYLGDGQRLRVTVTDVDLAGEVEPWRTRGAQDVRIVKDIYPPRIALSFELLDANGAVVKEGERKLTDLAFNMKININQSDPRMHEKALIDDWLRNEFKRGKK